MTVLECNPTGGLRGGEMVCVGGGGLAGGQLFVLFVAGIAGVAMSGVVKMGGGRMRCPCLR